MKKADIIENLKEEIKQEAGLVNATYEAKKEADNKFHHGKVSGLCHALSLYDFEIDRMEFMDRDSGLRKIAKIELNDEPFFREM